MRRVYVLAWLVLALAWFQAAAGAFSQARIEADTDKKQVHLGEMVRLKVAIVQQAAASGGMVESATAPELPPLTGLEVTGSWTSQSINMINNAMVAKSEQQYVLVATQVGKQTIPPISYRYADPQTGQQVVIQSRPIEVEVLPIEPGWGGGQGAAARALITAGKAGAALIALGVVAALLVRRRRGAAAPPPAAAAEAPESAELRRLRFFLESNQPESFYTAVSDAVRVALERRYYIPALTQTTGELVAELRTRGVDELTAAAVKRCLERCDLAKFAGYPSSGPEMQETFDELRGLLAYTRPADAAG